MQKITIPICSAAMLPESKPCLLKLQPLSLSLALSLSCTPPPVWILDIRSLSQFDPDQHWLAGSAWNHTNTSSETSNLRWLMASGQHHSQFLCEQKWNTSTYHSPETLRFGVKGLQTPAGLSRHQATGEDEHRGWRHWYSRGIIIVSLYVFSEP